MVLRRSAFWSGRDFFLTEERTHKSKFQMELNLVENRMLLLKRTFCVQNCRVRTVANRTVATGFKYWQSLALTRKV